MNYFKYCIVAFMLQFLLSGCVQEAPETKADVCREPYTRINGLCCLDDNRNGVCDRAETTTTKERASSVSSTTLSAAVSTALTSSSSTSTSSTEIGPSTSVVGQCKTASECGQAYYGSCGCRGNNITRTVYTPACIRGVCKYKSDTEIIKCYRQLDARGEDTVSSERCVQGYANCIVKDDYERYMVIPEDATVVYNITKEGFTQDYMGYRFRLKRVEYPQEMRCFDYLTFYMDVMKPDGTIKEIDYAWNRTVELDDTTIGLARVNTVNGSFTPAVWVLRD